MSQYNLRSLSTRDYAAMDGGDLDDNEFDFPPAIVPPGTSNGSNGNPASQSSTPLTSNREANGWKDEIAELNLVVTQAKAENADLESRAELHALRKRNTLLQSKTARDKAFPAERAGANEPSVTIKDLCADPALTARVSAEVDRLGLSSSDSEDKDGASNKKSARGTKLRSGKTAKLTSRVVTRQLWPHSFLSLAYVSKDWNYDELTLAEFAAGDASILQLKRLSPDERTGCLDHFIVLMYLVTQSDWPAVQEFHVAVLFEIECGRARWGDSFAHLESQLLRAATTKPTSSLGSSRQLGAELFCRNFQSGKCPHSKDHYGMIRSERKWRQHICAKCWTLLRSIMRHTDFSEDFPSLPASPRSSLDPSPVTSA